MLEVKEKFISMKADLEKQMAVRSTKVQAAEAKARQREMQLNQQQQELQRKKAEVESIRTSLTTQVDMVEKKKRNWSGCIKPRWKNSNIFRVCRPKKQKTVL